MSGVFFVVVERLALCPSSYAFLSDVGVSATLKVLRWRSRGSKVYQQEVTNTVSNLCSAKREE